MLSGVTHEYPVGLRRGMALLAGWCLLCWLKSVFGEGVLDIKVLEDASCKGDKGTEGKDKDKGTEQRTCIINGECYCKHEVEISNQVLAKSALAPFCGEDTEEEEQKLRFGRWGRSAGTPSLPSFAEA